MVKKKYSDLLHLNLHTKLSTSFIQTSYMIRSVSGKFFSSAAHNFFFNFSRRTSNFCTPEFLDQILNISWIQSKNAKIKNKYNFTCLQNVPNLVQSKFMKTKNFLDKISFKVFAIFDPFFKKKKPQVHILMVFLIHVSTT